ncbi:MAG: hypothetical protein ACYDD4_12295 [Acidimicrobiales bacterium]
MDERKGFSPPIFYRADALRALRPSRVVETKFVLRAVGSEHRDPRGYRPVDGSMDVEAYYREYFENILEGDYVLAVRGNGNYSVRFYEALACGRIPLYVDTDCVLPPLRRQAWDSIVLRVDRRDIGRIGSVVAKRHREIGPEEFRERQQVARAVWSESLSMAGFFRSLHATLSEVLAYGPIDGPVGRARLCQALGAHGT